MARLRPYTGESGAFCTRLGMPTKPASRQFLGIVTVCNIMDCGALTGIVRKILTHPHLPFQAMCPMDKKGPGGRGQMLKRVLRRAHQ
jgi:hypothetical protein